MSTITVTNIKKTGETASRAVSGIAAAWVNIDQTGVTYRDSLNTSSLTDNADGDTTVTFSSSFGNASYSIPSSCTCESAHARGPIGFGLAVNGDNTATSLTSSACRMRALYGASASSNGGALDVEYASAMYMGDLA